jgi:nucleotide-binding universal stress UspA family protein
VSGTIVIGVDGSASSDAALRWALEEARLRGASLRAVYAWEPPPLEVGSVDLGLGAPGLALPAPPSEYLEIRQAIEQEAARVVPEALARAAGAAAGVNVEQQVVEGPAGDSLVEAAAEADLLVVGSHGRGGLTERLLGSTSQHCVRHAHCPVVVHPPVNDRS